MDSKEKTLKEAILKIENGDYAVNLLKERTLLEKSLQSYYDLHNKTHGYYEILSIADDDILKEISEELPKIQKQLEILEINAMFNEESDKLGAIIEINSGAGGTESQDWSQMLERMYIRWAEDKGFKIQSIHRLDGEEAGIKQSILSIEGENVYGMLKYETGVHRLVRVSPFNAQNKRQTSFASAHVTPIIDETITIEINPSDLKIDTYRSSGAGGQHVNTTDSAVRITHIPTGTVAACQNQRSQLQNRETAMRWLQSKLYAIEEQKRQAQKDAIQKDDISWGNQIRNYVLHPYKLVKDTRTSHEDMNPQKVLDGNIDEFIFKMIYKTKKPHQDEE